MILDNEKAAFGILSAAALFPAPVLSDHYTPYTVSALGCMKLGDCRDGVYKVTEADDLDKFGDLYLSQAERAEAEGLIEVLEDLNVDVYISESRYFPTSMVAVYYTDINTIFLNGDRSRIPTTILESLRHEGWHTVQDCMAGSIENTFMAVIFTDEQIPNKYKMLAQYRYGRSPMTARAVPWEKGAIYAGATPNLTLDTLKTCKEGPLWESIKPTPLTMKWLTKEGYIK